LFRLLVDGDAFSLIANDLAQKDASRRRKEKTTLVTRNPTDGADGFAESRRVGKRRVAVLVHYNKVFNFGNEENSVDWKKKADFTDFS
jgi:hypothetical protein